MTDVQVIDGQLLEEVARRAEGSERRRMNFNFHTGPADNPHRFLNVLLKGTYIRPHRHADPPKSEAFLVLEGTAEVIVFEEDGAIRKRYRIGDYETANKTWGVDLAPGVWHTVVALTDRVVCYEVKPGPWEPASDKEFAAWAPQEGEPAVAAFLERLTTC